ncbi:TPA: heme anaerobic degradation radical SAM methyltransferase ChuW/HutW [Yersinia enterocolitica]|uniref:heme anaerobic degradation radical SAM methyltransferase ChuW/HutW n=1 Tax=Yersinia enterocolitica TaxID=630 RepID=UPI0005E93E31|nr:heme anaerobic degradation radical SAM methyltransferase ChuW/HutW [Yersinia enterocolitica]ELI8171232.1 heme anaerobic degradation radical SAM methyltransferase ChuW/HutW [Yersinia enterocolitica]ELW7389515.1 heme anaerobic degradation radical SAM methyltransferase ChuW/HutW [Yersinia enterocolitica]ELZ1906940.1 heme anaerobic degradation radical SAM methyltransferase ChuW/HutW [Yersinia enterocolitica]EMA7648974.1 heme anaerobic degradation radical SAM methyltransferase ChuW/HutW [Yersinia
MNIDLMPYHARQGPLPFPKRWATMPWRDSRPLPAESLEDNWQALLQKALPPNKRLLYLHIPFCATHCTFCGFYQNPLQTDSTARYTNYLLRELSMEASSPLLQGGPIHAIYFGGGTPSALSAQQLHSIISQLRKSLPLAPDCEITVEGRIFNFDDERIDACLEAGANRFSVGVQTFNTRIRQRMGRKASRDEAIHFLTNLASRDRAAVVCDLMFGLPHQTPETWQEDLAIVRQLPLDGVDLYALNLLPTTPLAKSVENNRIELPTLAQQCDFYCSGAESLAQAGWHQLSNSHWARTTRERNLYNLLIKQGADCLALGSGAGGSLQGHAYMQHRSLDNYYRLIDSGQKPLMMMTQASGEHPWRAKLQSGIEVGRLDLSELITDPYPLMPLIAQWHQSHLLKDDSFCLRLTDSGRFWASNIMQALQNIIPSLITTESHS